MREDLSFIQAKAEERRLQSELKQLEEMGAPDADIVEQHIKVTRRLLESGNFVAARDELERTDQFLQKSTYIADKRWRLLKRLQVINMIAAAYRDYSFYEDADKTYQRAEKVIAELAVGADSGDTDLELARLNLLNNQGVLQYLWANASAKEADRDRHFKLAEARFQKCINDARFYGKDRNQSEAVQPLITIAAGNLTELLKDCGRQNEISLLMQKL